MKNFTIKCFIARFTCLKCGNLYVVGSSSATCPKCGGQGVQQSPKDVK